MILLSYKGNVCIYSQEGGYASPSITVNGREILFDIEEAFKQEFPDIIKYNEVGEAPGEYEITIRQIK